jgi:hypothetical protein
LTKEKQYGKITMHQNFRNKMKEEKHEKSTLFGIGTAHAAALRSSLC